MGRGRKKWQLKNIEFFTRSIYQSADSETSDKIMHSCIYLFIIYSAIHKKYKNVNMHE